MPVVVKKTLGNLLQDEHNNYYELVSFFLDSDISNLEKEKKATYLLNDELDKIQLDKISLPHHPQDIKESYKNENQIVGQCYQDYLNRRKAGSEREYFKNVGQAFEFLIKVAPVKKVDGSWLYSLMKYWSDPVFHDLILIYLEELGLGQAKANHVCIYDNLLRKLGLEDFELFLEDEYYHQPAIQLALAYAPPVFIPEIIGFNLGYEQLPLHLLITNYELKELGIDAKYFNLHITIDNLDNGHAHKSFKVFENIYKKYKDKEAFMEKVKRGYALNQQGISSVHIIKNLNLENLVHAILKRKALVGQWVHNDQQEIGCKTINQWLTNPQEIGSFIDQLVEKKWIKLNCNPEESVFWRMISHAEGKMYGVFTPAERQIIHDWMGGEQHASKVLPYKNNLSKVEPLQDYLFRHMLDEQLQNLQAKVDQTDRFELKFCKLMPFLAPEFHHQGIGLWSTRKYAELLFPYLTVPAR
ncbi:iron-containing redox enzyme family protein [Acinetobacter sp. S40]|uniref:iron-containing redox enzyme family protein n=1 Tax=Acinetobacter sp. S40 TaxID=2767434 RepID=UPI00190AC880|nr:iron-containing redox enzyme family protein [Acinetobacter sp. S40]MBJ9984776.1 iron-containing redox enzyme family protein [Acinetobacter sp. S40]